MGSVAALRGCLGPRIVDDRGPSAVVLSLGVVVILLINKQVVRVVMMGKAPNSRRIIVDLVVAVVVVQSLLGVVIGAVTT
jgi:hypothetical protein